MKSCAAVATGNKRKRGGPAAEEILIRLYRPEAVPEDVDLALGRTRGALVERVSKLISAERVEAGRKAQVHIEREQLKSALQKLEESEADIQANLDRLGGEIRELTGGEQEVNGGNRSAKRFRGDVEEVSSGEESEGSEGDDEEEGESSDQEVGHFVL
jgi:hypothetical protein